MAEDERARGSSTPPQEYPELRRSSRPSHPQAAARIRFVQFHVWVPADWTVQEAHDRLDHGRRSNCRERFPDTEILIHVDPEGQTDRETLLPQEITEQAN